MRKLTKAYAGKINKALKGSSALEKASQNQPVDNSNEDKILNYNSKDIEYCNFLWKNREWINRRVDTVYIDKPGMTTTSITFDINPALLLNAVQFYGQSKESRIQIPLMILDSSPLLEIDVELNGAPQSVGSPSESINFTSSIVLSEISQAENVDPDWFNDNVPILKEKLVEIVTGSNLIEPLEKLTGDVKAYTRDMKDEGGDTKDGDEDIVSGAVTLAESNEESISSKAEDEEVNLEKLVLDSIESSGCSPLTQGTYILTVNIDLLNSSQNAILKVKLRHRTPAYRKQNWGITGPPIIYPRSELTICKEHRYHFRIQGSKDVEIYSILPTRKKADSHDHVTSKTPINWRFASVGSIVSIHDRREDGGNRCIEGRQPFQAIQIDLRPYPTVSLWKAVLVLITMLPLLIAPLVTGDKELGWSEYITLSLGVTAFSLAFPKLFGAAGEDEFTSRALGTLRIRVGVALSLSLMAGTSIKAYQVHIYDGNIPSIFDFARFSACDPKVILFIFWLSSLFYIGANIAQFIYTASLFKKRIYQGNVHNWIRENSSLGYD